MHIRFQIHYKTIPGQQIAVCGNIKELGSGSPLKALRLIYHEGGIWKGEFEIPAKQKQITYKYILLQEYGDTLWEWGKDRILDLANETGDIIMEMASWRNPPGEDRVLYNAAFRNILLKANQKCKGASTEVPHYLEFRINMPRISERYQVCVSGNQEILGNWDLNKALLLGTGTDAPLWKGRIALDQIKFPLRYKYGIYDPQEKKMVALEEGYDREYKHEKTDRTLSLILSDESFRYPFGNWKGAGVSLPVFSIRSSTGWGTGEFPDLKGLIDWAKSTGLKMVQILPVNDTTAGHNWLDSYPYKSVSVMALHPLYLNPEKAGKLEDEKLAARLTRKARKLNEGLTVDYPAVMKLKMEYLKALFMQDKERTFRTAQYEKFFKRNESWLVPYAAFCWLRDRFGTADFRQWGEFSQYDFDRIVQQEKKSTAARDQMAFHYFLQYHLDKQLGEMTSYARNQGIILKGDIPIGISPNSVEAWTEPHLFNLDAQAGAPPDDFAIKGQNWGFPTYNWTLMEEDSYAWWQKRLQQMGTYFDAYRIDHILGFFRIWEIPMHAVEGILGYFQPCLPLTKEEIKYYGINWSYERMVKPYIKQHVLIEIFGERSEFIIGEFLEKVEEDHYQLKDTFDTQQKINAYFLKERSEEDLQLHERQMRDGLFDLVSNVIFLEIGEDQWHPRVMMHHTSSYAALDNQTKEKLNRLYDEFYYRRHNDFWYHQAMKKLPYIMSASEMLVCGEDLGMVPDCVPPVMDRLHILSLEIQRMPKDPKVEFAHPADAPYLSVCTSSTHDMSTIRGWWEENREKTQRFYNQQLGNPGPAPFFAEPWVCEQIIRQHLFSPAMWVTLPMQDLLAIDGELRWEKTQAEQINVPANPRHQWKFRMHQSIGELLNAERFNNLLRKLVDASGRTREW